MGQIKAPGRFHLQGWKGKIYARSWPQARGRRKSALQQAQIDRFGCLACLLKFPDGITRRQADTYAEDSGWYWRDVLHAAASGKLIRFQELKQIMTPTASVTRLTNQSIPSGADTPMSFTAEQWDNNNFWNVADPTKIVVKSGGLYLLGWNVFWTASLNAFRGSWFRVNGAGGQVVAREGKMTGAVTLARMQGTGLWYFENDDYFELICSTGNAGDTAQGHQVWIVAITPETIL